MADSLEPNVNVVDLQYKKKLEEKYTQVYLNLFALGSKIFRFSSIIIPIVCQGRLAQRESR